VAISPSSTTCEHTFLCTAKHSPPSPVPPGSASLMIHPRSPSPGYTRTHIGACSSDANRRAVLARRTRPTGRRSQSSRAAAQSFVTTRAGTDTMARRHHATDDAITQEDDTAGAATFGGSSLRGTRQVTPPSSMPADLRTVLAMPTTFGPKLFELSTLHAVSAACKVKVKDAGDLFAPS
jgi:hypothetical protein